MGKKNSKKKDKNSHIFSFYGSHAPFMHPKIILIPREKKEISPSVIFGSSEEIKEEKITEPLKKSKKSKKKR